MSSVVPTTAPPSSAAAARPAPAARTFEQQRRLRPRLWDTDWMVLRGMHMAIDDMAARLARPGLRIVDFGCGAQPYAPVFTARGATYVGADFGSGHEITIGSDGKIDAPSASCDLVVSFQVLEHVRDLDTYLAEAARILRPGGQLLLSTHGTWLYHPHPEDHRRWTREGLIGDLARRGFETAECVAVTGPLAWTTMVRLTCFAVALRKVPVVGPYLAAALAVVMNLKAAIEDKVTPAWVTKDNACVYVTLSRPVQRTAGAGAMGAQP
jgi:SAM-dependent methyltransferase